MLILGHMGITLGAATTLEAALNRRLHSRTALSSGQPGSPRRAGWFSSLAERIDIRILLVGSLLPDIIDKPVGRLILQDTINNGRIFCHTLPFLLIISTAGICLYRSKKKNWLLVLSFGTFTHLIFDQMWLCPRTLFWPLFGWTFERGTATIGHWLAAMLAALLHMPVVYIPEIAGAIILGIFCTELIRQGRLHSFIRTGKVDKTVSL